MTNDAMLKEHLTNLHDELMITETMDEDTEKLLKEISEDVKKLLSHKGKVHPVYHATVKERLSEAARHFDVSHPSLAATMRTVVHTLNTMGI